MEDLLPYYERELAFLRRHGKEFAERYPKIAGRLLMSGDGSQDPHVERLVESFALLTARVSKKIEDDYPEFTDALLEVLYPHYLRPFPSCSIVRFDLDSQLGKLSQVSRVPRGTLLNSQPVRGVSCKFRTSYEVVLAPIRVKAAKFNAIADAPMATTLPPGSGGQISLTFELLGDQAAQATASVDRLRLFTDGEPSFVATLRDALALNVRTAYLEHNDDGRWRKLAGTPLQQVGFADDESLIDYPDRSHPAYRLLTEAFAYPEKFGFFDLDLRALRQAGAGSLFTVHFILKAEAADSPVSRALEVLGPENVLTGCTPVTNLFPQQGEPIRVTHRTATYPVVADSRRAFAYEVHSIDSVARVRQTPQGEHITEFRPFYSLHHGETPIQTGQYWLAHRDENVARSSPGYETEMSFVDLDFNPALPQTDVVSLKLTCSNRDLPTHLSHGPQSSPLLQDGGGLARAITLLRKPSRPLRFERGRAAHWRLISHLSLNHLSLTASGLPAFKEMLRLYDMARSAVSNRQIDGIVGIRHEPSTAWLPGKHFTSVVRGLQIKLTIDEHSFVGAGISTFAAVLDRFFGLYVHANSFTQLTLLSAHSGEVIVQCPPRSGESILV